MILNFVVIALAMQGCVDQVPPDFDKDIKVEIFHSVATNDATGVTHCFYCAVVKLREGPEPWAGSVVVIFDMEGCLDE